MSFWYYKIVKYKVHMIPLVSVRFCQESRSQASQVNSACHAVCCCKGYCIHFYNMFWPPVLKKAILQVHTHILLIIPNEGHRKLLEDIWIQSYS